MDAIRVSDRDAADPKMVRRHLNALYEQTQSLLRRLADAEQSLRSGSGTVGGLTEQERGLLRSIATGSTDNPVAAQNAVVPTVSAKPPVTSSVGGQLIRLASDGRLYIFNASTLTWEDIAAATAAHNVLSTTHADTLAASVVRGDLIVGNSTPKWARLAKGTADQVLRMDGAGNDPGYGPVADAALSANVALRGAANTFTVGQLMTALAGLTLGGGAATFGASAQFVWSQEEVTLSTVSVTTDSTALLIPGSCIVLLVGGFITQTISGGGVTGLQIGDNSPSVDRFFTTASLTAGISLTGLDHWAGSVSTDARGPLSYSSAKVRLTATGGTPTQGKVRVVVLAMAMAPPSS